MTEHTRNHGVSATPTEYLSSPGSLSESVEGDLAAIVQAAASARERHAGYRWAATPEALLDDDRVSDGAVRLYGLLARYANRERVAWPGQELLAARMKRSESTIKRLVRELQAAGWITVVRENRQRSNHYILNTAVPGRDDHVTTGDKSPSVTPPDPDRSDLTPQPREVSPDPLTGQIWPVQTGQIWPPNESQKNESQKNETTLPPTPAAPDGAAEQTVASKPKRKRERTPEQQAIFDQARTLAQEWSRSRARFVGNYLGLQANMERLLTAGWSVHEIQRALVALDVSVPSLQQMERTLNNGAGGRMRTYGEQEIARYHDSRGAGSHEIPTHF